MAGKHYKVFKRSGSANWQVRIYTPVDVQKLGKPIDVVKSTGEGDHARANVRAAEIFEEHRAEWAALRGQPIVSAGEQAGPTEAELLALGWKAYESARRALVTSRGDLFAKNPSGYAEFRHRQDVARVGLVREMDSGNLERWQRAAVHQLGRAGLPVDDTTVPAFAGMVAEAAVSAIDVENRREAGDLNAQPSSPVLERARKVQEASEAGRVDLPFGKLVEAYMRMWKASRPGDKETNTEQQKEATFKLFGQFWRDKPIRAVKGRDAAEFRDAVKLLHADWARSSKARELHWDDLIARFGNQAQGLSASTMNRHMRTLQSLWDWAKKRDHCDGENPFTGFNVKIKLGENSHSYRAWENDELARLFDPLPKRRDLLEVMIVALFTGMRLDEIASLTWGRVRVEGAGESAITYFDIADAKTTAGIRQVPVHSALGWLVARDRGAAGDRLWPKFNLEGVGDKAGADAGKMFSDLKIARGFADRLKTFHSFRKNVTRIMERGGVPENEWAQVFGHERGFTYSVYNPDGITMKRKAEIISLIEYPGLTIPHPSA